MKNQIVGIIIGTVVGMIVSSVFQFSLLAAWKETFGKHPNDEKDKLPQADPLQLWMNSVTGYFR